MRERERERDGNFGEKMLKIDQVSTSTYFNIASSFSTTGWMWPGTKTQVLS